MCALEMRMMDACTFHLEMRMMCAIIIGTHLSGKCIELGLRVYM